MIWLAVFAGGSVGVLLTFWFFRWLCKDKNKSNIFESEISDLSYPSRPRQESSSDDLVAASLFAVMAISDSGSNSSSSCDSSSSGSDFGGTCD